MPIVITHSVRLNIDFAMGEVIGIIIMPIVVAVFFNLVLPRCQRQRLAERQMRYLKPEGTLDELL